MAIPDVLPLLICPVCGRPLTLADERVVRCGQGHAFDLGRQGYLNLLRGGRPGHADTAAMVAARDRFLAAGHYRPLAERLRTLVVGWSPDRPAEHVLEVGAGTGYYLSGLLDGLPLADGVAVDVSVPAARRAARAHSRLGSVVADVWAGLPVADQSMDVVVDVFAPRNPAAFERVLAPGALLVVVTPEPDHLHELRAALGLLSIPADKSEQLAAALGDRFEQRRVDQVRFPLRLDAEARRDLVAMGPNAFHLDEAEITARLDPLPLDLPVRAAVAVSLWTARRDMLRRS